MNDTRLNLDIFENADDETARKIAAYCSASDSEKERMFAMSRKIYQERTSKVLIQILLKFQAWNATRSPCGRNSCQWQLHLS